MKRIKRMPIKEFREQGYLQELNRRFLHPLGLALEVIQEEDGTESLGGVWDYRNDMEGIYYNLSNPEFSNEDRIKSFNEKFKFIESEIESRKNNRENKLGFFIEPIPEL
jgi:hypothetical protein